MLRAQALPGKLAKMLKMNDREGIFLSLTLPNPSSHYHISHTPAKARGGPRPLSSSKEGLERDKMQASHQEAKFHSFSV